MLLASGAMKQTHRYAYLHGFASSAGSRKGTALAARFADRGLEFLTPDLNSPSFARLTYTGALAAFDTFDARTGARPWQLVGSSMGGYLAARWAELHPSRVDRLVLLCPGFDLGRRWPAVVGADGMARWRAHGALTLPNPQGEPEAVHWGFIEDALRHPAHPEVPCPTLIIHGRRDEVVPLSSSEAYAADRRHVTLHVVDDDHGLAASIDEITTRVFDFFGVPEA